ncbi:MAG: isoprenylcysteine carboxylmethyltransferase family protein [Myxococcota bacterium]
MTWLETRIPPPLVAALCGGIAWILCQQFPALYVGLSYSRECAGIIFSIGFVIAFAALWSFRVARTTFDPHSLERTSSLVTSGIYRWTRNPMYLGLALVLLGWCAALNNALSPICIVLFVLYMNRLQIRPEERVLLKNYGSSYRAYCERVRRWL